MTHARSVAAVLLALFLALALSAPAGAGTLKHSGRVLAVDPERGRLVLEEIGPWRVKRGVTQVTRLVITLTPSTTYSTFIRVDRPDAFQGDFIKVELDAADVSVGDFVTVDCAHEGKRLRALQVSVAELKP